MKTLFKKWVKCRPCFFRANNALGLLLTTVVFSAFNASANSSLLPDSKHVLYINSYHQGYAWSDGIEKGVRETLAATSMPIEVSTVHLDTERYDQEILIQRVAETLRLKQNEKLIDVVIASDAPAIQFVEKLQPELFQNQTIVVTSTIDIPRIEQTLNPYITGISSYTDYLASVEFALSLHPDTQAILFVGSTHAHHNQRLLNTIKVDVIPNLSQYTINTLADAPLASIQTELDKMPTKTLVFLLSDTLFDSETFTSLSPAETARTLSSMSSHPVYSFWYAHLGHGIVGGKFATGYSQGKAAAQIAVIALEEQVMDGRNLVSPIPFSPAPDAPFIDAEVSEKHGISASNLPNDARIINQQTPIWQEYKTEALLTLIAVFALISAVLGFFLLTRRQNDTIHHISDENSELSHALDVNKETLDIVEHKLEAATTVDSLTGLSNAKHFTNMLDKELKRATRYQTALSLLMLTFDDYDNFMSVYGESNAEKQLARMGKMIATSCQRSSDLLAYRGQGSFAIILPHTTCDNALIVCEKLHDQLKKEALPFGQSQTGMMTISIGVSSMEGEEKNVFPHHMLSLSEAMCEEAEKYGGNVTRSALVSKNLAPSNSE
ncbi:diguanylate cyclase [Enterovibrio baiacu]|uniref:diguanylate cyclase n=1 Tax=Enterovibrio baiacu TaxID=2491023 RepID=UPI003D100EBA